ncbi:6-phosphogluconate dehydrogenase [uncultured Christiangramia sp.]|uniref:6-phosphogluconate dehydrogenase n=1 Tax=uncultured Christiangramia sp. TaxID=503836 RepID=UPI0025CD8473|nr:6-phosphogluconate dehydrogenase [uncultured Christiangramia sp.]|tara:strand:+ start:282 stop:647 length:366 start_codon:yes stop_codon:yes gene_type:complete
MKKTLIYILGGIFILWLLCYAFVYFVPYSEGTRSGELIKFSRKGVITKTWEGEISQGISGAQIFSFSVLDKNDEVIKDLQEYEGNYVKLTYIERYSTFFFWGDSKYFITEVEQSQSPHFRR